MRLFWLASLLLCGCDAFDDCFDCDTPLVPVGSDVFEPEPIPSEPSCGNGRLDRDETCDDGNAFSKDGCNLDCTELEPGFSCDLIGAACKPICGDGTIVSSEACDDGNTENGDGCSESCQLSPGFECPVPGEVCHEVCGNGLLSQQEACDDGNQDDDDGCSADCRSVESGFVCPTAGNPCIQFGKLGQSCAEEGDKTCLDESCCRTIAVPGGILPMGEPDRFSDAAPEHDVTITPFRLDKYEVSVSRFHRYVNAYDGAPVEGAGAHQQIPGSGWQPAWNALLPADSAALAQAVQCSSEWQTTTTTDAALDTHPINCVSWYLAFAFCVWDGGRLPTEAEWEFAAAGGEENRSFPWGSEPPDGALVAFSCNADGDANACSAPQDLPPVGSRESGAARFGHLDLAGSVREWVLDWYSPRWYSEAGEDCDSCANLTPSDEGRVTRGGDFYANARWLRSAARASNQPNHFGLNQGFRCAYSMHEE